MGFLLQLKLSSYVHPMISEQKIGKRHNDGHRRETGTCPHQRDSQARVGGSHRQRERSSARSALQSSAEGTQAAPQDGAVNNSPMDLDFDVDLEDFKWLDDLANTDANLEELGKMAESLSKEAIKLEVSCGNI